MFGCYGLRSSLYATCNIFPYSLVIFMSLIPVPVCRACNKRIYRAKRKDTTLCKDCYYKLMFERHHIRYHLGKLFKRVEKEWD